MNAAVKNALIIGGGFSGMAAAIQLRKLGIEVDLVEIDPQWCPLGAGITISGPTLRALDMLGVLDEVAEEGYLSSGFNRYATNGELLGQLPTRSPDYHKEIPGGGGILRPVLAKILSRATTAAGVNVKLGCTYSEVKQDTSGVDVTFTDGTTGRYDLMIGADGVHSKVRQELFPEAPAPTPIHQSVWRAVLPRPTEIERPSQWLGEVKIGVNPISDTHMYMFITEDRNFDEWIEKDTWADEMATLVEPFSAPLLQGMIPHIKAPEAAIDYRPLANLLVPLPWHKGRIVMIGDTVHGTTPHLASGAGIGIESAIVLAEELGKTTDLETALTKFENRRWSRCRLVIENSARLCEIEKNNSDEKEHAQIMQASMSTLCEPI